METYYGHVRTPADAIILFEACRIGLLPRVQRRLSEKERQSIRSGSVFVWDEREAGMRRWTDGKSWSASRVAGSFLTYREMEGKRGGAHAAAARAVKTPESNKGSDEDQGEGGEEGPDGYRYKPDGLMKQSFSITTSTGQHLHLISYYARAHPTAPGLNQPSSDPALRHIRPQKGLYPESSINDQQNLPVVTRGPMAGATYSVPPPALGAYPSAPPPHHPYAAYAWAPPIPGPAPVHVSPYGYLPHPLAPGGQHPSMAYGHYAHIPPPHHYPHHVDPNYPHHLQPAPGYSYAPYPSSRSPAVIPQHNGAPPPAHPHQHPSQLGQVDPRLMPPPSESERQRSLSGGEQLPSISQQMAATPSADPQPLYNGSRQRGSSATVVPSINALMNGPPPPPPSAPRPEHQQNGAAMSGMVATAQPAAAEGPQDIPSEKIGFGEDARALRQLDRVFSA